MRGQSEFGFARQTRAPGFVRTKTVIAILLTVTIAAMTGLPILVLSVPVPRPPRLAELKGPAAPARPSAPIVAPEAAVHAIPVAPAPAAMSATAPTELTAHTAVDADRASSLPRNYAEPTSPPANAELAREPEPAERFDPPARPALSIDLKPVAAAEPLDRSAQRRKNRVAQFGGTIDTENAVEAGLIWLAEHQQPDGTWDRADYRRQCPSDNPCPGWALQRLSSDLDPGLTGLCVLAFLGAGYSDRDGPHQRTVRAAVAALLRLQQPDGGFSADETMAGYNNSLATFALAELYALNADDKLIPPLTRAVSRLVTSQQAQGGWDYLPRSSTGRNDTSITGWAVQALQACAAAGIPVPRRTLTRAALHVARSSEADGRVWYADAGTGFKLDDQSGDATFRYGGSMLAVGLASAQLLGWRPDARIIRKQQSMLLGDLPSAGAMQRGDRTDFHDYYYWYYGTIAAFQAGGETWQRWNAALRDALLPLQNRERIDREQKKHAFGSFPPYGQGWGKWGRSGGRVYTTAIAVLTLEIYYRHSPVYIEDAVALTAVDWRELLRGADAHTIRMAIETLSELRLEIGEPVLVELLAIGDARLALAAARELAEIDSAAGMPILAAARDAATGVERERLERQINVLALRFDGAPASGKVRLFDERRKLLTVDISPAYVGMRMALRRDGADVATLRVIQRFTGRPIVVAELLEYDSAAPPQTGDVVESR